MRGSPAFPLTREELLAKYRENATGVLNAADTERSIGMLLNIENVKNIGELMRVLSKTG